ncbi:hypothetical protein Ancab_004044 [Ancistrocladus abbreviatus]
MSSLSMVEAKLPPGFRFHPRDDELVCDYLLKKVNNSLDSSLLVEVDLNKCEPWEIPDIACIGGKEWYFYNQRDRKYATGLRTNRATLSGYWKATGKDRLIFRKCNLVGMRKTLVFYQGRAPKGRKTNWVMHEFRAEGPLGPPKISSFKEDWVLCRVLYKNRELSIGKPSCMASSTSNGNSAPTSNCYDETGSSPLTPLMDSYIPFGQTTDHNMNAYGHEQVPCFSSFSPTDPNQIDPPHIPHIFHHMEIMQQPSMPSRNSTSTVTATDPSASVNGSSIQEMERGDLRNLSPLSPCDAQVIKALLSHLSRTADRSPTVKSGGGDGSTILGGGGGEEASSESYCSHMGLPTNTMWSHY